ncbi:MAG: 4Fe-4S dicluster domain-containing protein [Candidatus Limnocylindrales bacterium]
MEVTTTPPAFMARPGLEVLIEALRTDGWRVIGPTIADGAIVYDEIEHAADLPVGWGDEQSPGRYRLVRRDDERSFGYVVGPTSWKRYTFPSTVPQWRSRHVDGTVKTETIVPDTAPMAFLGVRGCELAGIAVQDRVLRDGPVADADYVARRRTNFIVAVQCTVAASTCFCTSMGTGPEVSKGYDLALTEVPDGFLVEAGSAAGERVLARLPVVEAPPERRTEAQEAVAAVRRQIGHPVATEGLPERLLAKLDDAGWIDVAERCLGCANCTLVCPTCFCTSVGQVSDLDGLESTAERHLDSCFSPTFARVAGGDFRPRHQDRYRQWLTHKFATWVDQFGSFGCVGCGRCVTWCPVGIDVRQELATIAPAPVPIPAAMSTVGRALPVLAFPTPPVAPAPAVTGAEFRPATVTAVRRETPDTVTLHLADLDARLLAAHPGQFVMVEQPAFPAVPVSISRLGGTFLELTIRAAGPATKALTTLGPGAQVSLRGPLGRGWPLHEVARRELILVAGGLGLAPLRPLIEAVLAMPVRPPSVRLYLGARTPGDRLFTADLPTWSSDLGAGFAEIVDRAAADWYGRVGIVTHLFDENWDGRDAVAFVCGPERMMQAVASTLAERGVSRERTWVTMERHMECGVGLCGHCQLGRVFVCRDGPVFSLAELGDAFGREGL